MSELAAGLDHLPVAYRSAPSSGLELVWSPRAMPFGLGDGSKDAPEWSGGRNTFHLYAYDDGNERRASHRLRGLTRPLREALWRRRALVHALVMVHDDAQHWSGDKGWRRLNGWVRPFERPLSFSEHSLNTAEWAYSRSRGRASAALDLATFAEEALVPVEHLQPAALAQADQVRCQEFSKSRFLAAIGLLVAARGPCETFDSWASEQTLDGFEFLFVAASGRAPESLFGHLLLRILRTNPDRVVGPGLTPAVQLVALTGGDLPGPLYALRGLTGGYPMVLMTVPMLDVTRQMLEYEQRTMRRFRLRLTPGESRRLLERIWEMERRGRLDYRFLHDNCAFAAAFVVNGALEDGREIKLPSRLSPLMPATTLDSVARASSGLGGPLLVPEAGALESTRDLARASHAKRMQDVRRLLAAAPQPEGDALRELLHRAESPDGRVRLAAYERFGAFVEALPPEDVFSFLAHSADLERYAFDAAEAQAIKVKLAALASGPPVSSGPEEADQRARQFEDEDALAGAMALLDRPQRAQAFLEALPKRPFTPDEQRAVDEAIAADRRLDAVLALQARLVEQFAADVDPVAWLARDRAHSAQRERRLSRRSLTASGYGRTTVAAGATTSGGAFVPTVTFRSAAFSEELGDHRAHGLDPHSELTALAGHVEFLPGTPLPRLRRSEFIAAEYRNVRREPAPFRQSWLDRFGWGFRSGWSYDARRPFAQRAFVSAEGLAIIDDNEELTRFTAVGVGVHAAVGFDLPSVEAIAGPALSVRHRRHLGGNCANALKLTATYQPAFLATRFSWQHEVRATARLELLAELGSLRFIAGVQASVEQVAAPKSRPEWIPAFAVSLEPLSF